MPKPIPKRMIMVGKDNPAYDNDIPSTLETLLTLEKAKRPRHTAQGILDESIYTGDFSRGVMRFTTDYTLKLTHGLDILEIILKNPTGRDIKQEFLVDIDYNPFADNTILVTYAQDLKTLRITPTSGDVSYVDERYVDEMPARAEPQEERHAKSAATQIPEIVQKAQRDHLRAMQEHIKRAVQPITPEEPAKIVYEYDDLDEDGLPEYGEKDIMQPGLAADGETIILPYRRGRKEYTGKWRRPAPNGMTVKTEQKQAAELYQRSDGLPARPLIVRGESYTLDDVYNAAAATDGEEARERLKGALIAINPDFAAAKGSMLITGRMLEGAMRGITTIPVTGVPWQYDLIPEERAHRIAAKQHKEKEYNAWLKENLRRWESPETWTTSYSPVHRFTYRTANGLAEMRFVETKELAKILK